HAPEEHLDRTQIAERAHRVSARRTIVPSVAVANDRRARSRSPHFCVRMSSDGLAERYARVRASIPAHVKLVAVGKTRSAGEIKALYGLGQRAFGENYPQELRTKSAQLPPDIEWHFIGHLQRSNVKHVVPIAHLIHGIDGERLLDEVEKRAGSTGRRAE